MKAGAIEFLTKPAAGEDILAAAARAMALPCRNAPPEPRLRQPS